MAPHFSKNQLPGVALPGFNLNFIFVFLSHLIWGFAAGMIGLFLPIFLFEKLDFSIFNVIYFYLASFGLLLVLVPIGAKIMSKINLKRSMMLALPSLALYYLALYVFNLTQELLILGLAVLAVTFFRILYWIPYHIELAEFGDRKHRGIQIAYFSSIGVITGALAPFLAGFIIEEAGFPLLFFFAICLVLLAVIPIKFLSPHHEHYTFSYFQTFRELFSKKNWRILVGYGSLGAESMASVVIWPIFIFGILKESYVAVGGITAAIILVGIIFRIAIGYLVDIKEKRKLLKIGSGLYSLGWLLKMVVGTGFEIFLVGTYHSFAGIIRRIPLVAFQYEQMYAQGQYIDEYTTLREISINLGKILMLVLFLILLSFVGLIWTFVLAAIAAFLIRCL